MKTRLNDDLVLRYVSGRADDAEKAAVEKAAGESADCRLQLRAAEYLRDEFESVWDTLSAANIGKLWRKKPIVVSLAAYVDSHGNVVGKGGKQWRIPLLEDTRLGLTAEATDETERRGVAADGTHQARRFEAWCIPLGENRGDIKIFVRCQDKPDLWEVSCSLSDCSNVSFRDEARLRVVTDKDKDHTQMLLQSATAIILKSGKWKFEISHAETIQSIEVNLGNCS